MATWLKISLLLLSFNLYAGQLFDGINNETDLNLPKVKVLYRDLMWEDWKGDIYLTLPDYPVDLTGYDIAVLDLEWGNEHLPEVQDWHIEILKDFKKKFPNIKVGFYGLIPQGKDAWTQYYRRPGEPRFNEMAKLHDAIKPILEAEDITFPTAYNLNTDPLLAFRRMTNLYSEAKRLVSHPVYLFIWDEYHNATPMKGQDVEWFDSQLQFCLALDGCVIWDYKWEPKEWHQPYLVTKQEIIEKNLIQKIISFLKNLQGFSEWK